MFTWPELIVLYALVVLVLVRFVHVGTYDEEDDQ